MNEQPKTSSPTIQLLTSIRVGTVKSVAGGASILSLPTLRVVSRFLVPYEPKTTAKGSKQSHG
jgi:hypothetical protein